MKTPTHQILYGILVSAVFSGSVIACSDSRGVKNKAASTTLHLTLKRGQTATAADPGTSGLYDHFITFEDVVSNSRPDRGAFPANEGDAVVGLRVGSQPGWSNLGTPAQTTLLVLHTDPQFAFTQTYRGLQFYLDDLLPHPHEGLTPEPDTYVAKLRIVSGGTQPLSLRHEPPDPSADKSLFTGSGQGSVTIAPSEQTLSRRVILPSKKSVMMDEWWLIRLAEVTEDSRCPAGTECASPGVATATFFVSSPFSNAEIDTTLRLQLTPEFGPTPGEGGKAIYKGWTFHMIGLEPYPRAGKQLSPNDYVAEITVLPPEPSLK